MPKLWLHDVDDFDRTYEIRERIQRYKLERLANRLSILVGLVAVAFLLLIIGRCAL